jgi:hypothetical protein
MHRRSWIVVVASLIVLLVSCSTPSTETGQTEQALRGTPTVTAEGTTPTRPLLPATGEPTATSTPPPAPENPTPTHTLSPTAEEPAPAKTPQPTATPTAAPPTLAPTATTATVLTESDVQRITPAQTKALLDNGSAVLYDVRSAAEFGTQHAAGALSFPEADITARYGGLPADKSLIFY